MKSNVIRITSTVHTWSSLICSAVLLLACITGLPLVFQAEIGDWLDSHPEATAPARPRTVEQLDLDRVVAAAYAAHPDKVIRWISPDRGNAVLLVGMGDTPEPAGPGGLSLRLDMRTAEILPEPVKDNRPPSWGQRLMAVAQELHTELFLDTTGEIILAVMAATFVLSLLSGAMLYSPFMRKLRFGDVREKHARTRWIDLHNMLGIVAFVWMLVIGLTGAFNSLSEMVLSQWQRTTVQTIIAPSPKRDRAPVKDELASVAKAVDAVERMLPNMRASMVVYPNTMWVSPNHYLIWMYGQTPATSKLRLAALVDAQTGDVTSAGALPWYMQMLDIARPLHFGDYGGLALKIIWALLDVVTIAVLGSGVYLWFSRRKWRMSQVSVRSQTGHVASAP